MLTGIQISRIVRKVNPGQVLSMSPKDQTLTLPEVCKIARIQTDTLRMWYRKGYLADDGQVGWRRYSLREAMQVIFYAWIIRSTKDHEIATAAVEVFSMHMAESADNLGTDAWLICYRTDHPKSSRNLRVRKLQEFVNETVPASLETVVVDNDETLMQVLREMLVSEVDTYFAPLPLVIPIHHMAGELSLELSQYLEARDGKADE